MKLKVKTASHNYKIYIKIGLIKKIELPENSFLITDSNVKKYYAKYFKKYPVLTIMAGEKNKRLKTIEEIAEQLLVLGANRDSTLVALGGGVVGDITGFLAAIYMRGVSFIQIPTTLLAMVDASVGGKTGVDIAKGKNILGAFHQPDAVLIDPETLNTLPAKEFKNGLAEVIKHGIIDGKLFYWLEKKRTKIKELDKKILTKLVYKNILVKKKIVEKDEHEKNIRAILNLGHTFGHALETLSDYRTSHGEAVAKGIIKSAELANLKTIAKIKELFKFFDIKYSWSKSNKYTAKDVANKMKFDKKNKDKNVTLILPVKIGKVKIYKDYNEKEILSCLNQSK